MKDPAQDSAFGRWIVAHYRSIAIGVIFMGAAFVAFFGHFFFEVVNYFSGSLDMYAQGTLEWFIVALGFIMVCGASLLFIGGGIFYLVMLIHALYKDW